MSDDVQLFCTFQAGQRVFGIPLLDIKEITTQTDHTRIPHAPPAVTGYVNIRGQIVLALDLIRLLGWPEALADKRQHLVIFKSHVGPSFGLIVGDVGEIAAVPSGSIETVDRGDRTIAGQSGSGLISHFCKLPDQLLVVLDSRRFLPWIESQLEDPFADRRSTPAPLLSS